MAASDFWGRVRKLAASLPQRAEQFVPGEIFARPLDAYMAANHPEVGQQVEQIIQPQNFVGPGEVGGFVRDPAVSRGILGAAKGIGRELGVSKFFVLPSRERGTQGVSLGAGWFRLMRQTMGDRNAGQFASSIMDDFAGPRGLSPREKAKVIRGLRRGESFDFVDSRGIPGRTPEQTAAHEVGHRFAEIDDPVWGGGLLTKNPDVVAARDRLNAAELVHLPLQNRGEVMAESFGRHILGQALPREEGAALTSAISRSRRAPLLRLIGR